MSDTMIDLEANENVAFRRVSELCVKLVPGWKVLSQDDIFIEKISGGITNILLMVSPRAHRNLDPIVVRVFGPNTEIVIDRNKELEAMSVLSNAGFGSKPIAYFRNGVIQSYIHARTLAPNDLSDPKFVKLIAQNLRRFHKAEVPGSKEPQLWKTIEKYLKIAKGISFENAEKLKKYNSISFEEIESEISCLRNITGKINSPIVFAHNDLLSGNFMYDDRSEQFHLIDFEYGSYSYRGYDIGNHFNEYAGFDCDYSLYPSKDKQFLFFREYLSPDDPQNVPVSALEHMFVECNIYGLASHLFWGIWAIVQAKYSPIDFDYLGYFFLRYAEFKEKKNIFLRLVDS